MSALCQRPELCMLSETCIPCAICPNAKERSTQSPHEVLASLDESLSDITADAGNHNKGSILARANAAVRMLENLDQCRVVGGDTANRTITLQFSEMPENVTIGDTWWAGFLHNAKAMTAPPLTPQDTDHE